MKSGDLRFTHPEKLVLCFKTRDKQEGSHEVKGAIILLECTPGLDEMFEAMWKVQTSTGVAFMTGGELQRRTSNADLSNIEARVWSLHKDKHAKSS